MTWSLNQWADRELEIEGYEIVSEPIVGDIVAFKTKDSSESGHVGIVSGDGIYISADEFIIIEKAYYNYDEYDEFSDRVFRRPIKK
ncbi:MAG: hypothetical protein R3Y28_08725 [Candidatus Gastranaerophilales bacterium]